MEEFNMEEFNIEESDIDNCRRQLYHEEGISQSINRRKICKYLRKLRESGDDYKIKHIKKFYRIYNIFYQIKSLIFSKDTFEYTDKDLSVDDFSEFLLYIIDCIKADIINFIDIMQDNNFNNEEIIRINFDDRRRFNAYLNFKHFCD